jgi:ribonuclease HII
LILSNNSSLYNFDIALSTKYNSSIIGTDEAGRGPLAGPVVAAAVQLNLSTPIDGINDSKKLSQKKRERVYSILKKKSISWSVGLVESKEIDKINILQASLLAMHIALNSLDLTSSKYFILVDGNKTINTLPAHNQQAVIKGDSKSASIAAASIIAKVTRDRIMEKYNEKYPVYQFARHKGYPTSIHREKIIKYGLSPIHRRSFCEKILSQIKLDI